MTLTPENYYQPSPYMSASQFKAFLNCEACALAEAEGEHVREASTALVQGQYVDAYFTGNVEEFRGKHPELFKKDGELKATYSVCESAIERIERDPVAMQYLTSSRDTRTASGSTSSGRGAMTSRRTSTPNWFGSSTA